MYYFIEPMDEDDIAEVQAIDSQSFPSPWAVATYKRELRNITTSRYLVVRVSPTPLPPHTDSPPTPRWPGLLSHLMGTFFPPPSEHPQRYPIIGYGGVWLTVDDAHITTIAVDPRYRGFGVGELLLNGLIDAAYALEAKMLTLEVRVSNTVAQRLYVKYGFHPGGTRRRYYTDNGEDALIMWTERIDSAEYHALLSELRRQLYTRLQRQVEAPKASVTPVPESPE